MIGRLRGTLVAKQAPRLLVDVGGVGYELEAPMSTFAGLPELEGSVTLYTHLAVREDTQVLYGFATEVERELFRTLIRVSGIGARLAITILSGMSPDEFVAHVRDNDAKALTRLPGIGRKTAERLLVEVRDRLDEWETRPAAAPAGAAASPASPVEEAVSALVALGYKPNDASRMVRAVEDVQGLSSEAIIREALRAVAK